MKLRRSLDWVENGVWCSTYEAPIWRWQATDKRRDGWTISKAGLLGWLRPTAKMILRRKPPTCNRTE